MESEILVRQIADQRVKIEELEKELLLKNRCLSLIAHDFTGVSRNLLWLIEALNENTISLEMFKELYPELKSNLLVNQKTIESTVSWINSQHQSYLPQLEEIKIYRLFNHIQNFFVDSLSEKNIALYYEGDIDASSYSDGVLIRFILKTLVENAIKYSSPGGDIAFIVRQSGDNILLTIRDSGVGMNQQTLENIFTLDKSPTSGTANEKGSGFSMVVANDFVKLIGGQLEISTLEGQGTTIELQLPYSQTDSKND